MLLIKIPLFRIRLCKKALIECNTFRPLERVSKYLFLIYIFPQRSLLKRVPFEAPSSELYVHKVFTSSAKCTNVNTKDTPYLLIRVYFI